MNIIKKSIISIMTVAIAFNTLYIGTLSSDIEPSTDNNIVASADLLGINNICTPSTSDIWVENSLYYSNSNTSNINNNYLQDNKDGTFSRIVNDTDTITIENYSADYELTSSNTISKELSIFGTFYSGSEYNFCVFGQSNPEEDVNCEVIRIVKYSKDWQRLDSASFYGCNTQIPFHAGRPRLTEHNGVLYLHTSHNMFAIDGINHQANMEIYVNINDMSTVYQQYEVGSIDWNGYISHSFDQYIQVDDNNVYTLNLGDAYPRSVAIVKRDLQGNLVDYYNVFEIFGNIGNNSTGVSLGGFELSTDNCISVGSSIHQDGSADNYSQRNIFLGITNKNLSSAENNRVIWLTDFSYSSDNQYSRVSTPKLVKLDDNSFITMWNETTDNIDSFNPTHVLHVVKFNSNGEILEDVTINGATLSDCDPIVLGNQLVWYSCEYESYDKVSNIYHIDYTNLSQYSGNNLIYGDCNGDGEVSPLDIIVLKKYILGINTDINRDTSDLNQDNSINLLDLLKFKRYILGLNTL